MGTFAVLDWAIIVGYLLLAIGVGVFMSRVAGKSYESYFIAERSLPWWWLGTSMVATTFAADTPLAITGMVAGGGLAANWFWWSWALTYVSTAVIFAALWRRARVVTDAELVELRYEGRSAALLRTFKAVFFGVLINGIILGWVLRAMSKISAPFIRWEEWLGTARFEAIGAVWPGWLIFGNLNDTFTIIALLSLITFYSTLGGIRGVIITDLIQFTMMIIASIGFAWVAVDHVGGMSGLVAGLEEHYENADEILSFFPTTGSEWLPLEMFLVYIGIQWWAQYYADGSGYIAQRIFTAKNDQHAEGGSIWFVMANFGLRTWPWILIALVSMVLFPLGAEGTGEAAQMVANDREMGYPVLMAQLLPAGLLGLMFASLLAAFMSTVDTHINWGSSYLINDIYKRLLRPDASQRELVWASRATVVGLALMAVLIASQISSIEGAWKFFIAIGAGLGLPGMLRWVWWRANAWTEIVGMTVAVGIAAVLYALYPDTPDEYLIAVIATTSVVAALVATYLTPPVPRERLEAFVERVRPPGFWRRMGGSATRGAMAWIGLAWLLAVVAVFGITFGIGYAIFGRAALGIVWLVVGLACTWLTLKATGRARETLPLDEPAPTPPPTAADSRRS